MFKINPSVRRLVPAALLVLAPFGAQGAGECDKYSTSYDRTYCYRKLFVESDKELNSVYNELRGQLKGRVRQDLVDVQLAWIRHRDQACQTKPGTIDVDCNYDVNRRRTDYLRDRLRECKVGNCRADMIAAPSWN